ncbi:phage holin family protein [Methanosphaera sp. WGK6]|uniref:phage holin family protein n=1 Tax=Methanosphaera sp. WGK6 TaxID=1561964 RepID=UPI00084C8561|nr:phage holin family protein [Methanosphaera sp. WGK6]OED30006.1 membrane protein [Methanosphaera sp. WGK6]
MINTFKSNFIRIIKMIIFLFLEVLLFFILSRHFGFILPNFRTAFIIILGLSIINVILWPIVSYLSLPFIVITLGFGTFLIDGLFIWCIGFFTTGVNITGFSLFTIPFLIGIINALLTIVLDIDEDSTYYRYVLKRNSENSNNSNSTGFIFLEIDGLARDILDEAIERGDMPTLKGWLVDGSHKLTTWETDLSSQTGASQAGILHGNNDNIPAFRWIEKINNNHIVSSNGFNDAALIESRISNGEGLLSFNGASRCNLFSGDAKDTLLTFSSFGSIRSLGSRAWYSLYSTPFFIARLLLLFIWDIILEFISRLIHLFKNIKPCLNVRGLFYYVARAGANVVMREASTFSLIGDIYSAKYDVIYTTYMGYDEIAHHSGIRDYDAFYALRQIDKQFKHINHAIKDVSRNYEVIVLSDHGQSGGPTFKQKYGITLNNLVEKFLPENVTVHGILHSNDDHFVEKVSLKDYALQSEKVESIISRTMDFRSKASSKMYFDELKNKKELFTGNKPIIDRLNDLSDKYNLDIHLPKDVISIENAQTIVLASGNLGLIYFTDWATRLSYEQIEDAFPGLIKGIASHPGIGFVMVHSSIYGTICLSGDNIYYMDDDKYVGNQFLEVYGENIVNHLKRTDSFDYVPDILVNSIYDDINDEVYAFEELIGSHGGVGGTQQAPFIAYPSSWSLDESLIGAVSVHKFFKKEIFSKWDEEN